MTVSIQKKTIPPLFTWWWIFDGWTTRKGVTLTFFQLMWEFRSIKNQNPGTSQVWKMKLVVIKMFRRKLKPWQLGFKRVREVFELGLDKFERWTQHAGRKAQADLHFIGLRWLMFKWWQFRQSAISQMTIAHGKS